MMNRFQKHPEFYINFGKRELKKGSAELIRSFKKAPWVQLEFFSNFFLIWTRMKYRHAKKSFKFQLKRVRESHNGLPDFLIIGAQKCGTTSLYHYLIQHPQILPCFKKETKYFDLNYNKSIYWYKSHFSDTSRSSNRLVTGEATPDYIFFPEIAEKIAKAMPHIKLIAIFRNPTERAYSQYKYSVLRGFEYDSFEDAIEKEPNRMRAATIECQKKGKPLSSCDTYREHSYIKRGLYSLQIKFWLDLFPPEQFLFLSTDELQFAPEKTLKKITSFLDIDNYHFDTQKRYLRSPAAPEITPQTRRKLEELFQPYNNELFRMIDHYYYW